MLVYNPYFESHVQNLQEVLVLLAADQWKIKRSKCSFAHNTIAYLGHVISSHGVATDPSKIEAISSWHVPANTKELRSFLGLAGYYMKFVQHFGAISQPLTSLLKKGVLFIWTMDHQVAFQALKHALVLAPVLALPNFTKPFIIETDASDGGVGAVLMQVGHPIAFLSKALGPKSRGLSTYEKEFMAILLAVQQWRSYLQQGEFIIHTDHKSLSQLNEQRLHTMW
jgi:transposase InsO family protein